MAGHPGRTRRTAAEMVREGTRGQLTGRELNQLTDAIEAFKARPEHRGISAAALSRVRRGLEASIIRRRTQPRRPLGA